MVKFVYNFFLPQTFINQQYEAIFKQIDHFHNKQKNAIFWFKNLELSFFSHKIALVMLWEKKDNSKLWNIYK